LSSAAPRPGSDRPAFDRYVNERRAGAGADLPDLGPFAPPTQDPRAFHRRLPGYAASRLTPAPDLARRLGVATVLVKDESWRLGLSSYKILGASWAVYREVLDVFGIEPGPWRDVGELAAALRPAGRLTLVAATDGNHGRAVARVAALLGWGARIYVPAGTSAARIEAITGEGARVTVVDGSYDDAVARSAQDADARTLVISDTAWPGYERVPRRVVEGYSTIFWEVEEQLGGDPQPTVVAVQMGVGSLAAAAVLHYRTGGRARPRLVGVEPASAACVLASARAGAVTEVPGPHRSIMAGLNCGLPSPLALPLITAGMDEFVAVADDDARVAMRDLAAAGIEAGESGAAGLAGLLVGVDRGLGPELGLTPDATVLLLSTEGATDPAAYRQIVGTAARSAGPSSSRGLRHAQ
jgi:diaminopropionate ammonia-lyase